MRQHEKYQTICDYALTISYDMGNINYVSVYAVSPFWGTDVEWSV